MSLYSVQNMSQVTTISFSGTRWNYVFTTLLTCFIWSLFEWFSASFLMWGITHRTHPVTAKQLLMCIFLFCHWWHTEELRLTTIDKSILSGLLVSMLSSSSMSLSDELHTLKYDQLYIGNSFLLSISDDNLIVDILVILEY